jgi:hypothetical protein
MFQVGDEVINTSGAGIGSDTGEVLTITSIRETSTVGETQLLRFNGKYYGWFGSRFRLHKTEELLLEDFL